MSIEAFSESIAILGPGLLGGSLALALQNTSPHVTLWGRREFAIEQAKSMGVMQATTDLEEAVADATIVILGTPVGAMPDLVQQIIAIRGESELLISDVGSVKRMPTELIQPLLEGTPHHFIGGHPMAGSEKTGMAAARGDLFEGAQVVLTPVDLLDGHCSRLQALWEVVGARCSTLTPEMHDEVVGRFSHYPHLIASLCADVALSKMEHVNVSGNGLRDTTRVASGDAAMWTEILLENTDSVTGHVEQTIEQLTEVLEMLKSHDKDQLQDFLQRAKTKRDTLTGEREI